MLPCLAGDAVAWLTEENDGAADNHLEGVEWLELSVTAVLTSASGICLIPDATVCTALTSALYSAASDHVVAQRELTVRILLQVAYLSCVDEAMITHSSI